MRKAAKDHVRETGKLGMLGHSGADGSTATERISRYGKIVGQSAETIVYGDKAALEAFLAIVIDDGVKTRGHRKIVFNNSLRKFACFFGPHKKFKSMAVCVYAEDFQSKLTRPQALLLSKMQSWLLRPMVFKREVEDYLSWTDKMTVTNEEGVVTKTVTRTFLFDDEEPLVLTQSETEDFNDPEQSVIYDPNLSEQFSDVLTEFDPSKMPTEESQKLSLRLEVGPES